LARLAFFFALGRAAFRFFAFFFVFVFLRAAGFGFEAIGSPIGLGIGAGVGGASGIGGNMGSDIPGPDQPLSVTSKCASIGFTSAIVTGRGLIAYSARLPPQVTMRTAIRAVLRASHLVVVAHHRREVPV